MYDQKLKVIVTKISTVKSLIYKKILHYNSKSEISMYFAKYLNNVYKYKTIICIDNIRVNILIKNKISTEKI